MLRFEALAFLAGAAWLATPAAAQGTAAPPTGAEVSVCRFAGGTPDAQIAAAIASLPSTGGVVDDRCHSGTQSWSANPFGSVQAKPVTLLLGSGEIILDTPGTVTIPTSCRLQGISRNATLIIAGKNFPANTPMFTMGDHDPSYNVIISQVGISTNGVPGVGAILNLKSQEKSMVSDVSIYGLNGGVGIDIGSSAAQNSGPYENLEILTAKGAAVSTIGIRNHGAPTRAIRGVTVNASGSNGQIARGIEIGAGGKTMLEDYHCEHIVDCLYLDGTDGVVVIGIYGSNNPNTPVATAVHLTKNNQFVSLLDINNSGRGGVNIQDDLNGITERGAAGLGWYATGFTVDGKSQSIFSSSPDVYNYTKSLKLFPTTAVPACASPGDVGNTVLLTRNPLSIFGYCTQTADGKYTLLFNQMNGEHAQTAPGGNVTLDTSRGSLQSVVLNGNASATVNAGSMNGQQMTVQVCNGQGNFTWTWPANVRGGGPVSTGPNRCQAQTFAWSGQLRAWIPTGTITSPY